MEKITLLKGLRLGLFGILSIMMFSGFFNLKTVQEKRDENDKKAKVILESLYKDVKDSKRYIESAYGYGVFSSVGLNVVLFSAEGGEGLVHANGSDRNIYMNMASAGLGFGMGIKDFDLVFIFENRDVFERFVKDGWEANAQVDAVAKLGEKGEVYGGAITVVPGMKLYKLTKNGLALQATIQGTKYWKNDDVSK